MIRDVVGLYYVHYANEGAALRYQECRRITQNTSEDPCLVEMRPIDLGINSASCGFDLTLDEFSSRDFRLSLFSDYLSETLLEVEAGRPSDRIMRKLREIYPDNRDLRFSISPQELIQCSDFNVISIEGDVLR